MPVCRKCKESFPCRITIAGKVRHLGSRKYCLTCSPFGKHNTRYPHFGEGPEAVICTSCGRKYVYAKDKGHTKARCNSCFINDRRFIRKKKCVEYKGGACIACGYSKSIRALQFHHVNPEEKLFAISGSHCRSWVVVKAELDKCLLMCCRCHVELHEELDEAGR